MTFLSQRAAGASIPSGKSLHRCKETDIPDKDVDTWLASKLVPTSFCGQSGVLWTLSGFLAFPSSVSVLRKKNLLMSF